MNALQDNRTKPGRALPRVWRRFAFLRSGERFDFKGRTFVARSFRLRIPLGRLPIDMERRVWIFPWTRVRTHTLVREKAFSETLEAINRDRRKFIEKLSVEDYPNHVAQFGEESVRAELSRYQLQNNDDSRSGPSA